MTYREDQEDGLLGESHYRDDEDEVKYPCGCVLGDDGVWVLCPKHERVRWAK